MKIQNDDPGARTAATDLLASVGDQTSAAARAQAPSAQADQITLSPEARALKGIADLASEPVAVRQDVVDRMKALLDKGAIGDDPARLADAIINDWLTTP